MKRRILILATMLAATLGLSAQTADYSAYYRDLPRPMPMPQQPVIPDRRVSLTDFGAVGDGQSLCTDAFAKAIAALAKQGGGHLDVPAGVWLTGPITLKDCIDLHLDRCALVLFSPDRSVMVPAGSKRSPGCIRASKRHDVAITGEGVIDGNGEYWRPVKRSKVSDTEWSQLRAMGGTVSGDGKLWYPFHLKHYPDLTTSAEAEVKLRNHMVQLTDCERVLVQGVTLRNSPNFHLVPRRCTNVVIDGVTVACPWNAQNGDAMDIGNCRDVLIVRSTINAGDDGICMKGGAGQAGLDAGPCENINIQDCRVYRAHGGFVIGSEFSGGMRNIYVHRCTFAGTDTGLRFKSAPGRGGETSDIHISDIYMTDIRAEAIVFQTDYLDRPAGSKAGAKAKTATDFLPRFRDIHISRVVCTDAATGIKASGQEVSGVTIDHSAIFCRKTTMDIAPGCDVQLSEVRLSTYK